MSHIHRCLVPEAQPGAVLTLSDDESHHLVRVARRRVGDAIEVIDGSDRLWPATVVAVGPPAVVQVGGEPIDAPPVVPVTLVVGLADFGRLDTLIEKATELGVEAITLMSSQRVRRLPSPEAVASRRARMERVADAAAKQSGRARIPAITGIVPFADILAACDPDATVLLDPAGTRDLESLMRARTGATTIIVGPDAGLAPDEVQAAIDAGVPVGRIGAATLRTETAAIVAATVAALAAGMLGT